MTIVLARRFDQRIIVLSDTMVSTYGKENVFPGRLKSIVINKWLTVSYAGLSNQAITVIRDLSKVQKLTCDKAASFLLEVNKKYNDAVEFILCSHENKARLVKVSNGIISEGSDFYWLGNSEAVNEIRKNNIGPLTPELYFVINFNDYIRQYGHKNVGGITINCTCSENGHCYTSHAGAYSWDVKVLGAPYNAQEREALYQTGMYSFQYNVCSTEESGIALVGLYLPQLRTGYLYYPIYEYDAKIIRNTNFESFSQLVAYGAATLLQIASESDLPNNW